MNAENDTTAEALTFTYRPSLLGAPWTFQLRDKGIDWQAGSRAGHMPYAKVRRVRMSYQPVNMQTQRFLTEVWGQDGTKLRIASTSWKSMVEMERLDDGYSNFLRELHRRLAAAAAPARYERGKPALLYWVGLAVFLGVAVTLAILFVRALQVGSFGGALFVAAFALLFVWQVGTFLRRNQPGLYRPDDLPAHLLPG